MPIPELLMRTHATALQIADLPIDDDLPATQLRAYAGDVLYTEGMPSSHLYVIKEGEVDLYMVREEKRVVIDTLSRGHVFGATPQLLNGRRTDNAVAKTYCEFYLVDAEGMDSVLDNTPKLLRGILKTLAMRASRASEVIASRVNFQPEIVTYAQLLSLVGAAQLPAPARKADARSTSQPVIARPALAAVFAQARQLFGHSDVHIRHILGKLLMLHLIQLDEDRDGAKCVVFSPGDIVAKARKAGEADPDNGKLEYEYISVDDFAAMVDLDRNRVLQKLARNELTEDLFTFRKSEVIRLLDEKGKKFFQERRMKAPEEFCDISDIEFADANSIQAVLSRIDSYDLGKLLHLVEEDAVRDRILGNLPRTKRAEIESEKFDRVDEIEVRLIGEGIIKAIQEKMLARRS
jgi:CRP-like cAMP-binding protein